MASKRKKLIKIGKIGKITAKSIAKAQGYDLRTKSGKRRLTQIVKKGVYKTIPRGMSYKQIKKMVDLIKKNKKKQSKQIESIFKKYKFNSSYKDIKNELLHLKKSKEMQKLTLELSKSWKGQIGSNLRKYVDRFTYDERKLFNKIINKMSDNEIERRFAQYAIMKDVTDLKYLYYPPNLLKRKNKKTYIKVDSDDVLLNDEWRLDTLKKYTDIFLQTAKNEEEYNYILKIFNKIAEAHSKYLDDE